MKDKLFIGALLIGCCISTYLITDSIKDIQYVTVPSVCTVPKPIQKIDLKMTPKLIPTKVPVEIALNMIATEKIQDMMNTDKFGHINSDNCDLSCRNNKINWDGNVGENLYWGPCDIRNAVNLWNKSPSHKEILDTKFNTGIILIGPKKNTEYCYMVMEINF